MIYGCVAQVVEHLTFNQVVRGSNPRTLIVVRDMILERFRIMSLFLRINIDIRIITYYDEDINKGKGYKRLCQ